MLTFYLLCISTGTFLTVFDYIFFIYALSRLFCVFFYNLRHDEIFLYYQIYTHPPYFVQLCRLFHPPSLCNISSYNDMHHAKTKFQRNKNCHEIEMIKSRLVLLVFASTPKPEQFYWGGGRLTSEASDTTKASV